MKRFTSKTSLIITVVVSVLIAATALSAQTPVPGTAPGKPKIKDDKPPKFPVSGELPAGVQLGEGTTSERMIAVDEKVTIQMCVTQGEVKVNGWQRGEVRAFVDSGSKFGFRVLQRSMKDDGKPVLISIVGLRTLPGGAVTTVECIAADEIALDVPENAAVTIKGRETETSVDSIRKVLVNTIGGDITVRNVTQGVRASTFQGDVTVENSSGVMVLESSSGNIVAYQVAPAEVGDAFTAKTNSGAISLEKLGFRLAEVNSLSGTILFSGEILNGGSLSFATTNGAIRLAIPQDTSCRITATYSWGNFNSELPIKNLTEDQRPGPAKTVNALLGAGDATLRLTTSSGSIQIKKL